MQIISLIILRKHGYDQDDRWGLYGDYDCSSAVITAWESAGVPVKTHGATYTGNMYKILSDNKRKKEILKKKGITKNG